MIYSISLLSNFGIIVVHFPVSLNAVEDFATFVWRLSLVSAPLGGSRPLKCPHSQSGRTSTVTPSFHSAAYLKDPDRVMDGFGTELMYLPSVHSIAFYDHDVPWVAVQRCLALCPGVTNLTFRRSSTFHVPFSSSLPEVRPVLASSVLEECSYPTSLMTSFPSHSRPAWLIQNKIALERLCLSSLILGADRTARDLRLPIGSAPLKEMAEKDWPSMRSLVLEGEFPRGTDSQQLCTWLSKVLPRMPGLRRLVVRASVPQRTSGRISILGHPSPLPPSFSDLESLTITYPDPHDAIFSLKAPRLVKLSIRDWPRHYEVRAVQYYRERWRSPVLSASEMLSSLRRMSTPKLTSLELVYVADDADDDLLHHIVTTFPYLKHLELHRYRRPEGEHVDYEHIVGTLAEIRTLVTLRLNLDFEEDPGRCMNQVSIRRPWAHLLNERGWRAVDILDGVCPELEYVQLVFHAQPPSTWVEYRQDARSTRAIVYAPAAASHEDSMPYSTVPLF
ncbi:hypothetical protein C8Q78DRAFT_747498 [Trametes maxima]|nr:hypothetical protein C8Q78DRAFT_747498 [Trametes maxima]